MMLMLVMQATIDAQLLMQTLRTRINHQPHSSHHILQQTQQSASRSKNTRAHSATMLNRPNNSSGPLYAPISSPKASQYSAHPST